MPEGPEIRRSADALAHVLAGVPLWRIEYRVPRLARAAARLRGAGIVRVYSRGKALLIEYDNGLTHYSHNQLYGEWEVCEGPAAEDARRAARVILSTPTHTATLYSATQIELLPSSEVEQHPYIAGLGPDVLNTTTTVAAMRARLEDPRFRGRSLASLLLDQRFAAGLGNYLRSDILFVAGLRASMRPRDLGDEERKRLARAILVLARRSYRTQGVTNEAARARAQRKAGVPFEDYRFLVYGRDGQPCWTCGTRIVRRDEGGRGLFHCTRCQPARRRAR
ncbi:MAG: endonuclease VIII [Burkholderiales bacterium]